MHSLVHWIIKIQVQIAFNGLMPLDEKRKSLTVKEKKMIENIKRTRQKLNVTQEDLSYKIGKNSNYMGMVESFRRGISFKTLFRVADALKVKVEKLFENL